MQAVLQDRVKPMIPHRFTVERVFKAILCLSGVGPMVGRSIISRLAASRRRCAEPARENQSRTPLQRIEITAGSYATRRRYSGVSTTLMLCGILSRSFGAQQRKPRPEVGTGLRRDARQKSELPIPRYYVTRSNKYIICLVALGMFVLATSRSLPAIVSYLQDSNPLWLPPR